MDAKNSMPAKNIPIVEGVVESENPRLHKASPRKYHLEQV
jgi:hypothetical protein